MHDGMDKMWKECGRSAVYTRKTRGLRGTFVPAFKYRTDRPRELLPVYILPLQYGIPDEERRPRLGISSPTFESAY